MLKKTAVLFVLIFILSSAFPTGAVVSGKEKTVYFSPDFENGLPAKTEIEEGEDGSVYTADGKLNITGSETYPPVTTVLFPYRITESEYVFECELSFYAVSSENCRFSLCFGAQSEDLLYQFSIKPGASAADSASLSYKTGEASWKTVNTSRITDHISDRELEANKFKDGSFSLYLRYKLSVAVRNGTAFGYIDGVKVIEGRLDGSGYGKVGFSCRGVTVRIYEAELHDRLPSGVNAADSFGAEPNRPDTGIIEPPLVMKRDKRSSNDVDAVSSVLFSVRKNGEALHCYDGAEDLGDLNSRLSAFPSVMPAFYVSDAETAAALSSYMSVNFINDAFIVVSQSSLCGSFTNNRYARIALDLSPRDAVDPDEVYRMLYKNGVRTLIVSEKAAARDTVTALRERMISVWASCSSDAEGAFNAAVSGVECIITSDPESVKNVFEQIKVPALLRTPVVISDGGDTDTAPSNSKTALLHAYEGGVNVLQITVKNTKDGSLVLCESDTTDKMSEKCTVSETELSYLKTLSYDDTRISANERIMTLDEFFDLAADEMKGAVVFISVNSKENAEKALRLASEYGVTERCVIVSDERSVINAVNYADTAAAACYSGGPYVFDKNDKAWSLSSLCETLVGFNSAYRGSAEGVPAGFLPDVHLRGIPVYVTNSEKGFSPLSGYDGYTVRSSSGVSRSVSALNVSLDANGRLGARIVYRDGSSLDVTALCELINVSGSVEMRSGTVSGEGVFAVMCPQTLDGEKYYVCSSALKTGAAAIETTGEQNEEQEEENNTVMIVTVAAAAVAVLLGVVILTVTALKRKTKKEKIAESEDVR